MSVIRLLIHGLITARFTSFKSTFCSRLSENFNCFSSFLCLSENRLSCSAVVPLKNPASVILNSVFAAAPLFLTGQLVWVPVFETVENLSEQTTEKAIQTKF